MLGLHFCQEYEIKLSATKIINSLGIPAHLKGYNYLRTSIIYSTIDAELLNGITNKLYPLVAKAYGSSPKKVERCIRNAIDSAWIRGAEMKMSDFIGANYGKPTNSKLIAVAADKIRLEMEL